MKALLSVSFGTSHADTRAKTIDTVEEKLRAAFPDCAFYSAWTSGRIIAKVKAERGENHDTLDEAFARMSADGVTEAVVSTMCLMRGAEMAKASRAVQAWVAEGGRDARLAEPLLASDDDRKAIARALRDEFSDVSADDAVLLMGHGSSPADLEAAGSPESNKVYEQIQDELHALGCASFFVGTVEGTPTFEDALAQLKERGPRRVYLAPLMIVAGDHAKNDLAGPDDDSWASQLTAQGFEVETVLKGLGEYEGVQQLVCDHVRDSLTVREVGLRD